MTDVVSHLKEAGFSDQEIAAWSNEKRDTLRAAGFDDSEVNEYFGIPKTPPVSMGLVDRMLRATDFSKQVQGLPAAVTDIPHEALQTTIDNVTSLVENLTPKLTGKPMEGAELLESYKRIGAGLFDAVALPFAPLQGALRSLVGHPMVSAVNVANKALGYTGPEMTFEEAKQKVDLALMALGSRNGMRNINRIELGPTGEPRITPVGGLPKGEDFIDAGRVIGNGDSAPAMEGKLAYLYEQKGIHPAEVAHDAQTDPTITQSILSSDKADIPEAYGPTKPPEPPAPPPPKVPDYSDAEKQILSKISIGEKSPETKLTWDGMYTNFIDRLFPISKAVKAADLAGLTAENNPYQLARLLSGHVGKADHFLNQGTFDFKTYENNGTSLKEILRPLKDDLNGFRAYAAAARAVELEGRGIKSGFAEGADGLEAAQTVLKEGGAKYKKSLQELVDYQNRVSAYLRDSGVLSDAGYKAITEANKMYVPFSRVMGLDAEARHVGGSSLQAHNPIKKIEGSARDIIDPIESVVRNTYRMIEMAEKNVVGTKLIDMLKRAEAELPEAPKAMKTEAAADSRHTEAIVEALDETGISQSDALARSLAHASEPRREGEIAILRDGKRETYTVDRDLARAMKGLDAQSVGLLEKVLAYPASVLRAGAVLTPDFQIRHTIRDFLYATTTFKDGVFTPLDMAKGFSGLIMKDQDYWNWLKGGGGNISFVGVDRQYLQNDIRKLTGETGLAGRAWNVLANPEASMWDKTAAVGKLPFDAIGKFVLDPLRVATQFAESASHLGAFKKTMRAAERANPTPENLRAQIIQSAWESRDTAVDAARMGANMRAYNMITAFANIKLQDSDRVVRAIKDNPIRTLTTIGAAITVPEIVLWAANHDDPRYNEIPAWQRDLFFVVMTPDHVFRIPKPWAMGVIFGSGVSRLLDAYATEKPDAFKDFVKSIWQTSGPDFVPTAAAPIIDQFANRSTFTNRTLIPSDQEKFLPEYQYTPYTTELTKALGKIIGAFPGMTTLKLENSGWGGTARALTSPILMENYLRGWTGTLGVYALEAADKALRAAGKLPDPPLPASTLADIPVIKAFVIRYPSANAESIQSFYDAYEHNRKYFDTYIAKAKDGDFVAMQHIQDMGGQMMFAQLDGIKNVLAEHSKIIRDVFKNPDTPPAEKRQLIDQLYFSMIQVSQYGNTAIREMRMKSDLAATEIKTQPKLDLPPLTSVVPPGKSNGISPH